MHLEYGVVTENVHDVNRSHAEATTSHIHGAGLINT